MNERSISFIEQLCPNKLTKTTNLGLCNFIDIMMLRILHIHGAVMVVLIAFGLVYQPQFALSVVQFLCLNVPKQSYELWTCVCSFLSNPANCWKSFATLLTFGIKNRKKSPHFFSVILFCGISQKEYICVWPIRIKTAEITSF